MSTGNGLGEETAAPQQQTPQFPTPTSTGPPPIDPVRGQRMKQHPHPSVVELKAAITGEGTKIKVSLGDILSRIYTAPPNDRQFTQYLQEQSNQPTMFDRGLELAGDPVKFFAALNPYFPLFCQHPDADPEIWKTKTLDPFRMFTKRLEGLDDLRSDANYTLGGMISYLQGIYQTEDKSVSSQVYKMRQHGLIAMKHNWMREAVKHFEKCIALNEHDGLAYKLLGHIYLENEELQDLPKAVDYFSKAGQYSDYILKQLPTECQYFRALSLAAMEDFYSAIEVLRTCVQHQPDFSIGHYLLARLFARTNYNNEMCFHLRESLKLDYGYMRKMMEDPVFETERGSVIHVCQEAMIEISNAFLPEFRTGREFLQLMGRWKAHLSAKNESVLTLQVFKASKTFVQQHQSIAHVLRGCFLLKLSQLLAQKAIETRRLAVSENMSERMERIRVKMEEARRHPSEELAECEFLLQQIEDVLREKI
jgi:tetratricopeptide (TPR) repeat protein